MPKKFNNIFLIGPMGSGKTTIGRYIAEQANLQFFDCDQEIVQRSGVEISWIFEQEGEPGFRRREHKMLKFLTKKNNIVLASGGGCVTTPANLDLLSQRGLVIFLQVSLTKQLERLNINKTKRPVFAANDSAAQLAKLNEKRLPLYESIADLSFNTDTDSPQKIAADILPAWMKRNDK